jgi:endonuclease/exonuclease/phosphatase family metal-dependent hydrolase
MVNHWPSRWGGENTTKSKRLAASKVLKDICDSVLTVSPGALIVAMGDFNDGPSDESLSRLSGTTMEHEKLLINLAHNIRGDVPGTIKYKHQWTCFDQILVSKGLSPRFSKTGMSIKEDEMSVVSPDFLLEPDPEYPGLRPKRTYSGYKYVGGLSDHLPVMIELLRMQ